MKISRSEEGVSEVFGYMLILGIVMTALMLFVLFGSQAIQSTKEGAQTTQAGQAFTVADSRLSKHGLARRYSRKRRLSSWAARW